MKKILIFLFLLIFPFNIYALDLYSKKYVVYDVTDDKILLSEKMSEETQIASLTKIMTSMVIIDGVKDLNKRVTITHDMLSKVPYDAYIINLKEGFSYTYNDLLYASILPSAADAAVALAVDYSGSIDNFVKEMNNKASSLGLDSTFFTNPIGLDNVNNRSTLNDVLKLLKYALKNDKFREIYTTKEYYLSDNKKIYTSLKTYNEDMHLNLDTSRIIGSKTGYTTAAGFCLSEIFESDNHSFISITLNAPHTKDSYHLRDGISIINYIDEFYNNQTLIENNTLLKTIKVIDSKINKIDIYSDKELTKYLPNDYNKDNFKIEYNIPDVIDYKTNKNLGDIKYYYDDELLYTQNIVVTEEIKPTFKALIKDNIFYVIILSIIIICIISLIIIKIARKKHK